MIGTIFQIKRFAIHDGDGIRTTIFFKGCPLKCIWCHNPEGIALNPQLAYYQKNCILCRKCVDICPYDAHTIENGAHNFIYTNCTSCGQCAKVCPTSALHMYGQKISINELISKIIKDKTLWSISGGGVTLSGGECLLQVDFCYELLKSLKELNINTAIDTCGFVAKDAISKIIPYSDTFLYDIKAFDEDIHIKYTGVSNRIILENLQYIDQCHKNIEIRIPYIPDCNSDQIPKIASFLCKLKNVKKIRVLPYHNYAGSKYEALKRKKHLPKKLPSNLEITLAKNTIRKYGLNVCD